MMKIHIPKNPRKGLCGTPLTEENTRVQYIGLPPEFVCRRCLKIRNAIRAEDERVRISKLSHKKVVGVFCCGNRLRAGSGEFAHEYQCPDCEADFDSSGHKLAPRSQWGEETGEQF